MNGGFYYGRCLFQVRFGLLSLWFLYVVYALMVCGLFILLSLNDVWSVDVGTIFCLTLVTDG